MADRQADQPDEGLETRPEQGALDGGAADWVWPIEHDQAPSRARCRPEAVHQRRCPSVEARPNIRHVEEQGVKIRQGCIGWPETSTVDAVHRETGDRIHAILDRSTGLLCAADAVLGRKEAYEPRARDFPQQIYGVPERSINCAVGRDQAKPLSADQVGPLGDEDLKAAQYAVHHASPRVRMARAVRPRTARPPG